MASEVDTARLDSLFNKLDNIARLEERVDNLENWQDKQNGSLLRLEDKFDKFGEKLNELNGKLDKETKSILMWLVGLLGGIIASMILFAIDLYFGK